MAVPTDQVQQREEEDPHDVDEVPVEGHGLDGIMMTSRELAGHAAIQDHPEHEHAAEAIAAYFAAQPGVDSVLLVNSTARGKATSEWDYDGMMKWWLDLEDEKGDGVLTVPKK